MTRKQMMLLAGGASMALLSACASQKPETAEAGPADGDQIVVTGSRVRGDAKMEAYAPPPPPPAPMMAAPGASRMAGLMAPPQMQPQPMPGDIDREQYENVKINSVKLVTEEPVSTFSIDVDTASYANARRFLNQGVMPPKDSVRIEELVNYFDYDYALPKTREAPFETTVKVVPSPWGKGRQLMHVGIQGYDIERAERPPLNLTLLLDVSGSMGDENKLPLAIKAMKLLIDEMDEKDTVSIAVYAGAAGTVLEPTKGSEKGKIIAALEKLNAGGSTAGGEGLRLAYSLAKQNFHKDSVNRVILMTDGDFNVGINDPERLKDFVERERESGV
jgi:Ca-activated chloride channel family protein